MTLSQIVVGSIAQPAIGATLGKIGSVCRAARIAKNNRALEIEAALRRTAISGA